MSEGRRRAKRPPPDHAVPYEVIPGLFISGHPDHARDFMLKGIRAVIDLEGDIDASIPEGEDHGDRTLYLYWPVEDAEMPHPSTVRGIASFVARLLDEDERVLVHCRSGHNRSGLICARTIIEQGTPPAEAIRIVREKRGDGHALSNESFVSWLQEERPSADG